ncbi:hypothetical protein [Larkinella soli]|uniref:hypothetical protein n=1 Tax=Larkinella soli TaxID=1770527 RepID=UPI000FFB54FC|nr:hypothetical protein [Larkinella soli]
MSCAILSVAALFTILTIGNLLAIRQCRRDLARNDAVRDLRQYVLDLDCACANRAGRRMGKYYYRLPPYDSMLTDGLPLVLESYFFDCEIRQLTGAEKTNVKP